MVIDMPKKSTKQKKLVRICPSMSRRITHPDYNHRSVEKLIEQLCVQDDCELWDPETGHCSSSNRKGK